MRPYITVFFSFFIISLSAQEDSFKLTLNWEVLTSIPSLGNGQSHPGLAGVFSGTNNDALIVAGGANFPNGASWEGGEKVFHDRIFVLTKNDSGGYSWVNDLQSRLLNKIAYGASVATEYGLICLGGTDGSRTYNSVFSLTWDSGARTISMKELPPMPISCANLAVGRINSKIYVAASDTKTGRKYFGFLDLLDLSSGWISLSAWPGPARTHAQGVVQNDGNEMCFFLIGGRFRGSNATTKINQDYYYYRPASDTWSQIRTLPEKQTAAGACIAVGINHIFLFGGDDGTIFNKIELLDNEISVEKDTARLQALTLEKNQLQKSHPGFSRDIWSFHTITQTWVKMGDIPHKSQVTTTALYWDDKIIIPSGEVAPSIRTPEIMALSLKHQSNFGNLNYLVIIIYSLALVIVGIKFSKNQKSTEDFFTGGKRIPWWAAGLSIFGTQLSAITFMAIPAKTYATDWLYFFLMMTIIMVAPFVIRFFLPFYRRYNLTTAYEYLELRFNLPTRLLGGLMYIMLQLGRVGIVLLLPSLALSVVTGIDIYLCILVMGILSILYTVLGGIEAVIWTDVLQVVILLGGALLCLALLLFNLDAQVISESIADFNKLKFLDFELSFSDPTIWVVLIGGFATNVIQYGSDQTVIQRYLTTKDEKSAARGITIGAWLTLPATLIFFSLGTLLFVYYGSHPGLLNPTIEKTDSIFPWFIINSLPAGVSGILIAAVFAASMSSLDSSMNSVATVITNDFIRRLRPLTSETKYLQSARLITIIIGILGCGIAVLLASWGISSLWDQFNLIVGLFAGGLGGIFILGIFFRKVNGHGALLGLILSGLIQYLFREYTGIHLLMYAFTGMISCIIIGYFASLFIGKVNDEKADYTYYRLIKMKKL